jgi:hypothetical protein
VDINIIAPFTEAPEHKLATFSNTTPKILTRRLQKLMEITLLNKIAEMASSGI